MPPVTPAPVTPAQRPATTVPAPAAPAAATAAATAAAPGAKPGRKPGQKAKTYDLSGISLEMVATPQEVSPEIAKRSAPQRARDSVQLAMDAVVKQLHVRWIQANKPAAWGNMPKAQYTIPIPSVEGFRSIVRRAADFHGYAVKFGTPVAGKTPSDEPAEIIVFAVRDRRVKAAK